MSLHLCVYVCVCMSVCACASLWYAKYLWHVYQRVQNVKRVSVSVCVHVSVCHGTLMSMHWASQIASEKLAILDCNHFIKSTTN